MPTGSSRERASPVIDGPRSEPIFGASPGNDETLAEVLRAGIAEQGPALLYAPGELERYLVERCPAADLGISMLLVALEEQVPQALLGAYAEGERPALIRRLEDHLHDRRALDRHSAQWVVETWASALRVGGGGAPRREEPVMGAAAFDPFANAVVLPAGAGAAPRPTWTFRRWHGVVGIVAALGIAAVAISLAMSRSAHRTAPERILDTLSAPAPVIAAPAVAPPPDPVVAATPPPVLTPPVPVVPEPAPVPVATKKPSSIVDIDVPAGLVAGKRFALTIDYVAGDRRPVSIERRRVGDGATARSFVVTPLSRLKAIEPGKLRYPLDAPTGVARRTLDFTLIDVDGKRSEPKRVVLDIARTPVKGQTVGCTRETCGTVQSVRDVETSGRGLMSASPARAASHRYDVAVRMDDRTVRTVGQARRLPVGSRVHWTGGRLIPIPRSPAGAKR